MKYCSIILHVFIKNWAPLRAVKILTRMKFHIYIWYQTSQQIFDVHNDNSFQSTRISYKCVCSNMQIIITQTCPCNIIQLLTMEALDMMWYRPEYTDIDRGVAEVNIGMLRSISLHVQWLHSQQLFYYIISLNKKYECLLQIVFRFWHRKHSVKDSR